MKEEPAKKQKSSFHAETGAMTRTVPMECDVRGMALDEAIPVVDQYLDEAVLASLTEVSIIHGKGTGVLRSGIQQHLRRHPAFPRHADAGGQRRLKIRQHGGNIYQL